MDINLLLNPISSLEDSSAVPATQMNKIPVAIASGETILIPHDWKQYYLEIIKLSILKEMKNSNLKLHKKTLFKVTIAILPELFYSLFGFQVFTSVEELTAFFGGPVYKFVNKLMHNSDIFLLVPPLSINFKHPYMEVDFEFKKKRQWELPDVQQ